MEMNWPVTYLSLWDAPTSKGPCPRTYSIFSRYAFFADAVFTASSRVLARLELKTHATNLCPLPETLPEYSVTTLRLSGRRRQLRMVRSGSFPLHFSMLCCKCSACKIGTPRHHYHEACHQTRSTGYHDHIPCYGYLS